MKKHTIFWWNLENLFDVETSPDRPDWLQKRLKNELKGWSQQVLQKKINNLVSVMQRINDGKGPDILGVCEVENENVMQRLMQTLKAAVNRNYVVRHHDTADARGIDIAFIYDAAMYQDDGQLFSHHVMKRNATRELLQINLTTRDHHELIVIGNHWPSRSGGQYESEPFRIMVAETLGYWIDRIVEIKGKNIAVVLMGDFNDEPFNRSIKDYLKASHAKPVVLNSISNRVHNLMYDFYGGKQGTYVYGNAIHVLDQFIVSRGIASLSALYPFKVDGVDIVAFPEMEKGRYHAPVKFGRPSKKGTRDGYNEQGFSDHFPIVLTLKEAEEAHP